MSKIYKPTFFVLMAFLAVNTMCAAQDTAITKPRKPKAAKEAEFELNLDNFGKNLEMDLKDLGKNLTVQLNGITPMITMKLNDLSEDFDLRIEPKIDRQLNSLVKNLDMNIGSNIDLNLKDLTNGFDSYSYSDKNNKEESGQITEKFKSYTKTYPLDANDKIKLSNQYGRIMQP